MTDDPGYLKTFYFATESAWRGFAPGKTITEDDFAQPDDGRPGELINRLYVADDRLDVLQTVGWPCRLFAVTGYEERCPSWSQVSHEYTAVDGYIRFGITDPAAYYAIPIRPCKTLKIQYEIDAWQVFGSNGLQVQEYVRWWRSHITDEGPDNFGLGLADWYRQRATLSWPVWQFENDPPGPTKTPTIELQPAVVGQPGSLSRTLLSRYSAWPLMRNWRRDHRLVDAWRFTVKAAVESRRHTACRYVNAAGPPAVALVLRDVIPPRIFNTLYEGAEDYYPKETLDSRVAPALYCA